MMNETLLRLIDQEKVNEKLQGNVLTLGRQNIQISLEDKIRIIMDAGIKIDAAVIAEMKVAEKDQDTHNAHRTSVSDKQPFASLGINNVNALDITEYDKAEVIHNINLPIKRTLENLYN